MAIEPIGKICVSDEVLEQIKSQIISGEWPSGTKIPGENELARMFQVSRVSVREAIHRLVGMGVLNVKRGEGTYVTEMLPSEYFSSLLPLLMVEGPDLLDILEFRAIIEVHSAGIAAKRSNDEDLKLMEDVISKMESKKGDIKEFAKEDLNFHNAVALATHNSVIIKVNAIIYDMMKVAMEKIVTVSGVEGGLYYHRKILEAIRNRDDQTAMSVMKTHIDRTVNQMKEWINSQDSLT